MAKQTNLYVVEWRDRGFDHTRVVEAARLDHALLAAPTRTPDSGLSARLAVPGHGQRPSGFVFSVRSEEHG